MLKKGNVLALFVFVIISFALVPFFGSLYEKITGSIIDGGGFLGWGSSRHPEYFEGFDMSYGFFMPVIAILFLGKKKYLFITLSLGLVLLLDLLIQSWAILIMTLVTAIISFSLTEVVMKLFVKNKPDKKV